MGFFSVYVYTILSLLNLLDTIKFSKTCMRLYKYMTSSFINV